METKVIDIDLEDMVVSEWGSDVWSSFEQDGYHSRSGILLNDSSKIKCVIKKLDDNKYVMYVYSK